ncbi:MAG: radical SAM protein [Oscillospiraceae bacterium]
MKHNNISIFIPHQGCNHACSFCNQNTISGTQKQPTPQDVTEILTQLIDIIKNKADTEIAFFGGSFTAINRQYMLSLLEAANEFVGDDKFFGIRISTRPDAIDDEILSILKQYNVTSIELGAQSMCDDVLTLNNRGHFASDVVNASKLIKEYGFSLGLQMMVGLYGDTVNGAYFTASEIAKIMPDTVRIYPTVILKGTKLGALYLSGEYKVMSLETAVCLCADLLSFFKENKIKVIKLGLHASNDVEADMLGGIYHPAFKELCENKIYLQKAVEILLNHNSPNVIIYVKLGNVSKMVGQKKINIEKLSHMGYNVKVMEKKELNDYEIIVKDVQDCY